MQHANDDPSMLPIVAVDCAAIPSLFKRAGNASHPPCTNGTGAA